MSTHACSFYYHWVCGLSDQQCHGKCNKSHALTGKALISEIQRNHRDTIPVCQAYAYSNDGCVDDDCQYVHKYACEHGPHCEDMSDDHLYEYHHPAICKYKTCKQSKNFNHVSKFAHKCQESGCNAFTWSGSFTHCFKHSPEDDQNIWVPLTKEFCQIEGCNNEREGALLCNTCLKKELVNARCKHKGCNVSADDVFCNHHAAAGVTHQCDYEGCTAEFKVSSYCTMHKNITAYKSKCAVLNCGNMSKSAICSTCQEHAFKKPAVVPQAVVIDHDD